MSEHDLPTPSDTFCILPWIHLSTRPDGSMRVCCTANASSVGATNDKVHGGRVGIVKTEDGIRVRSPSRGLGDVYKRQSYNLHQTLYLCFPKP